MSLIGDHFRGLTHFSGRERRQPFWLWVIAVTGVTTLAWIAFLAIFMTGMFQRVEQFARDHPDQVTRTVGPGTYSVEVHGFHPELMPDVIPMIAVITLLSGIAIFLLAAAVARRLHDSGRSGWWGIAPLPFIAFGFGGMAWLFSTIAVQREPSGAFFLVFMLILINNLVYLGTLLMLVIFRCMPSQFDDNRYGPAFDKGSAS